MRYAVTGSAGFIGTHLCARLRAEEHEVREYDRLALPHGVELSTDPIDFSDCDGVFHLAARPGVESFGSTFRHYSRDNVVACLRVFESAAAAGVRVLFASSSTVYGRAEQFPTPEDAPLLPTSPYGVTKVTGEHLARACAEVLGLDVVTVRYFTVYGPRQRSDMAFARMCAALRSGGSFTLRGDGQQSRSFTYISDAIDATLLAMEHGEGIYNIGGGQEVSLMQAVRALERISGRHLNLESVAPRLGDERRTAADTWRMERLGWNPQMPFVDGLRAQWEAQ